MTNITYGKRNGFKSRQLARDGMSPGIRDHPAASLLDLDTKSDGEKKETSQAENKTSELKQKYSAESIQHKEQKPQEKKIDDTDPFELPDYPLQESIGAKTGKLNNRRRERVKQRELEILRKQAETAKLKTQAKRTKSTDLSNRRRSTGTQLKSEPKSRRRSLNPRTSSEQYSYSRYTSDEDTRPRTPSPSRSIENHSEPELELKSTVSQSQDPKRLSGRTRSQTSSTSDNPLTIAFSPEPQSDHDKGGTMPLTLVHSSNVNSTSNSQTDEIQTSSKRQPEDIDDDNDIPNSSFDTLPRATPQPSLTIRSISQAEKDSWDFLERSLPVLKRPKLVSNLEKSGSINRASNSKEETPEESFDIDQSADTQVVGESSEDEKETNQESEPAFKTVSRSLILRNTYGSQRSYVSAEPSSSGNDLLGTLGSDEEENQSTQEEPDDYGVNLKSVHELRTSGGNTRFQDELQYILDGFQGDLSSTRSSLLDLAIKCQKKEFVQDLKVSGMIGELFDVIKNESDPIVSFLIGLMVSRMLKNETGLAAMLIQSYRIVPTLTTLVPFKNDITRITTNRPSKIFKSLLTEAITEIQEYLVPSRSLVGLTALSALQGIDGKVDFMLQSQVSNKDYITSLFDFGEKLEDEFLPILKEQLPNDEDEMKEFRTDIQLLHLVVTQLEFILSHNVKSSIVINVAEIRDPSQNFLLRLPEIIFLSKSTLVQDSPFASHIEDLAVSILKLLIVLTTNNVYSASGDQFSRRAKLLKSIYSPDLALHIIKFTSKVVDPPSDQAQSRNLELFSWGLLVNLSESEDVCTALEPLVMDLKFPEIQTDSHSHEFHCRGYQCLVAGLVITVKQGKGFTNLQKEKVRQGLTVFKESLNESWGQGLKNQVEKVLAVLESIM